MLQVFVAISQKFCCKKEAWAMQKIFIKRRIKEKKKGQVSAISKTIGTQMPARKKEGDE